MPGQRAQQRRFAAARRAEQADEFARRELGRHAVQHLDAGLAAVGAKADRHVLNGNAAGAHCALRCGRYQGISHWPARWISALLPMPSTPISSMPTMMLA